MAHALLAAVYAFAVAGPPRGVHLLRAGTPSLSTSPPSMQPSAELSVSDAIHAVCAGLQDNNTPHEEAGVERLYNFMTPMGRVKLAPPPPRSGLQGGVTLEDFLDNAGGAALGALVGCVEYSMVGPETITPGNDQGTRGKLATQMVEVGNSPLVDGVDETASLRKLCAPPATPRDHPRAHTCARAHMRTCIVRRVAADDEYLAGILEAHRNGGPPPPTPSSALVRSRFVFQWEQVRRLYIAFLLGTRPVLDVT